MKKFQKWEGRVGLCKTYLDFANWHLSKVRHLFSHKEDRGPIFKCWLEQTEAIYFGSLYFSQAVTLKGTRVILGMQLWDLWNYVSVCSSFYGPKLKYSWEEGSDEPAYSLVNKRIFVSGNPEIGIIAINNLSLNWTSKRQWDV